MLRGKRGKTFLVQFARRNGQFDTLEIRITLQYYFVQFVWIEKKSLVLLTANRSNTENKNRKTECVKTVFSGVTICSDIMSAFATFALFDRLLIIYQ